MIIYDIATILGAILGFVFLWNSFKIHDKWSRLNKKSKWAVIITLCSLMLFFGIGLVLAVTLGLGIMWKVFTHSAGSKNNNSGGMVFYRDDGVSEPGWYDADGYKVSD